MANEKSRPAVESAPAAPAPRTIHCKTLVPYAGHPTGVYLDVAEREYLRLRHKGDGGWEYPVLISDEHAAQKAEAERRAREKAEADRKVADAADGPGWGAMEQQALEETQRRRRVLAEAAAQGRALPVEPGAV
jgi:hypothetical protein